MPKRGQTALHGRAKPLLSRQHPAERDPTARQLPPLGRDGCLSIQGGRLGWTFPFRFLVQQPFARPAFQIASPSLLRTRAPPSPLALLATLPGEGVEMGMR